MELTCNLPDKSCTKKKNKPPIKKSQIIQNTKFNKHTTEFMHDWPKLKHQTSTRSGVDNSVEYHNYGDCMINEVTCKQ